MLDHTIVWAPDRRASADMLRSVFGFAAPVKQGPFLPVRTDSDGILDVRRRTRRHRRPQPAARMT
ncbi:hypothetical protein UA75_20920 [Actinoalloteichus sp. GBA129-24]|uniref:Uncharacterized protein n=1 Tax=Actinoalloteichus fjordicus TaxID=1612552 RepID=A0AAC9LDZ8_9PSEU|nr:hypothetical protein UA74_20415 [Actinoalloteichus fjordicus]APU22173.1 hypothetical protein UA75_20920 [Actinoalloteichus sp. GBA129-24]